MRIPPSEAIARIAATRPAIPARMKLVKAKKATPVEFIRPIDLGIAEEASIYLLRQGSQGILAPADDTLTPILGEWGNIDTAAEIPPNLQDWLGEYAREIEWHLNVPSSVASAFDADSSQSDSPQSEGQSSILNIQSSIGDSRRNIPALVTNTWGQGAPYNKHLVIDGKEMIVGCGALSAAQLIYYWGCQAKVERYHRGCMPTDAYDCPTMGVKIGAKPPITVFDYANMTSGKPKTAEQIEAVATLCEYVAKAFKSDFGPSGVGTSTYANTCTEMLRTKLRMGSSIKSIFSASGAAKWEAQVYNELANGRPVIMSGYNPSSGGGHAFVCDGYRTSDGKYHFNWGWNGSYNGWFALSALTPATRNYTANKRCIIGIQPDYHLGDVNGDGKVNVTDAMTIISAANSGQGTERTDINSDGKTNVSDAMIVVNNILGKEKL